jgi:protein-L-isoaspartate(D-aspartate) O-methyltransferase
MDFAAARHNMVESQIRTSQVTDSRVIASFEAVPREVFLPPSRRPIAYIDEDIALGNGRYMQEPLVLARLLQGAAIGPSDVVLQIGCASGYEAAVIARLAGAVVALECDPVLAKNASSLLTEHGIDTVSVVTGPLEQGYPSAAPYDVVVATGAVAGVPMAWTGQLAEGGRLVSIVSRGRGGRGVLMVRTGAAISTIDMFDGATPFLPGLEPKSAFAF